MPDRWELRLYPSTNADHGPSVATVVEAHMSTLWIESRSSALFPLTPIPVAAGGATGAGGSASLRISADKHSSSV